MGAAPYVRTSTLEDALTALADGDRLVLCGGTDVYPAHAGRRLARDVVDISAIDELRGIEVAAGQVRIGAGTTWSEIASADLPSCFDGLRSAALEVGSVQIQNAGTIGGNLCNASPAADGVPPLLTLDASVEVASASGRRTMPLARFLTGYRATALRGDELLTAVVVPAANRATTASFVKLGSRHSMVISIAMVAATLHVDEGIARAVRLAVGACSPVARRLSGLESLITGRRVDDDVTAVIEQEPMSELAPIGDIRASADYRRDVVPVLVARALRQCGWMNLEPP